MPKTIAVANLAMVGSSMATMVVAWAPPGRAIGAVKAAANKIDVEKRLGDLPQQLRFTSPQGPRPTDVCVLICGPPRSTRASIPGCRPGASKPTPDGSSPKGSQPRPVGGRKENSPPLHLRN